MYYIWFLIFYIYWRNKCLKECGPLGEENRAKARQGHTWDTHRTWADYVNYKVSVAAVKFHLNIRWACEGPRCSSVMQLSIRTRGDITAKEVLSTIGTHLL